MPGFMSGEPDPQPLAQGGSYCFAKVAVPNRLMPNGVTVRSAFGEPGGGEHDCGTTFANECTMNGPFFMQNLTAGGSVQDGTMWLDTSNLATDGGTSTLKLKKDIAPLSDHIPLDSILDLQCRSFKWIHNDATSVGFIAEEVAEVNPLFAIWGHDWSYDEKGAKIQISDSNLVTERYQRDSDNLVPIYISERAILSALVEKIQELESILKVLEG
jgi:hypothetical protein